MGRLILAAMILWPVCGAHAETLWAGNAHVIAATPLCANTARVGTQLSQYAAMAAI